MIKTIVPYAGGKAYMLDDIYEIFHKFDNVKTVIDVFGGSGKFLLNLNDTTLYGSYHKIYNDIDDNMVNLFTVLRDDNLRAELINRFEYYISSRSMVIDFQKRIRSEDRIEWAYRVMYILINSFNARYDGVMKTFIEGDAPSVDYYLDNIRKIGKELRNWTIENLDFDKIIKAYDNDNTFFYFDPPYYGLNYYRYSWNINNFHRFARAMRQIQGHYIFNINDTDEVRRIFGEPNMVKKYVNHAANTRRTDITFRNELFYWK
ncbi:MAG: DNA adenine methylase [Candidatus Parvarchaeum sp.]